MNQIDSFHYPPDLLELMVNAIAVLNRGKKSVLLFFRGAGISDELYKDIEKQLDMDKDSIGKYDISRTIITRINEKSEQFIKERRELLKRVIEFEAFSNCWPADVYKAKGLVADIQKIVNVKDSFTKMKQEKDKEQLKHSKEYTKKVEETKQKADKVNGIKKEFYSLFSETNPQARGKKLEGVLNSLFNFYGILVREAFSRKGDNGEGIIEQIDGVIEIDNRIYLMEMKWKNNKIGSDDINAHLVRMYHRTSANGIFISASGYSDSGILAAKEALIRNAMLILCDLEEFVPLLENGQDLVEYFRTKIKNAIIDKQPYSKG